MLHELTEKDDPYTVMCKSRSQGERVIQIHLQQNA
ncbi:hypothetical protein F441_01245 [Phytophthora nicotianae CJ01A1]|uniref:Uncharacterized protein n=1 Tax=Phytophthora nicotianae CJ01A1 TaxID=1317063 RepID=W2XVI2_PHYNI|nr:hypothetical protein F441_01245 [Phytophthora nicotianae CJ01A1]